MCTYVSPQEAKRPCVVAETGGIKVTMVFLNVN